VSYPGVRSKTATPIWCSAMWASGSPRARSQR